MSKIIRRAAGFTMLELAIAVAIVGLLVAVAMASYQDSQAQKARAEAVKSMLELADGLRKQQAVSLTYLGVRLAYAQSPRQGGAKYRFSLAAAPVQALDPAFAFPATSDLGYTLMATPAGKDACGVLLLDHTGRRGVTVGKVTDCWR
ncbi:MAG: prepilin-type N-terminal cleavage/methylation domain-containing protein [Betaproteobacteria bacterium]|nr:prepilin-type N-terminal cleavage/methylation domain-containing protein [Betaproteobacteria bacterium]